MDACDGCVCTLQMEGLGVGAAGRDSALPRVCEQGPRRALPFHALRVLSGFTQTLGTLDAQCESTPHTLLCVGCTAVPPHRLF